MRVARLAGGAHALLAVVGYNFARFQLAGAGASGAVRRGLATVGRVAVPTSMWIGLQMLLVGGYSAGSLFLVNNYFGSAWRREGRWEYWYFEAFVQVLWSSHCCFRSAPFAGSNVGSRFAFAFRRVARGDRGWAAAGGIRCLVQQHLPTAHHGVVRAARVGRPRCGHKPSATAGYWGAYECDTALLRSVAAGAHGHRVGRSAVVAASRASATTGGNPCSVLLPLRRW